MLFSYSLTVRNLRSNDPIGVGRMRLDFQVDSTDTAAPEKVSGDIACLVIFGQFSSFHLIQFLSRERTVSTALANANPSVPTLKMLLMDFLVSIAHLV
jgi:hypothetical protein